MSCYRGNSLKFTAGIVKGEFSYEITLPIVISNVLFVFKELYKFLFCYAIEVLLLLSL